ncbi:cell division topological specificity factor MinE [Anaerolentibacter hominis]|uniref:cell division topological specificity factor MinE n=1 Tax=Anaerolentibacter hominis TaxID=3079009 RepID=UPI0031B8AAE9
MMFRNLIQKRTSGKVAKDRLKLVLVSDRTNCSPEMMEQMKKDILHTISKYVEIDKDKMEIKIESSTIPVLFANIPIRKFNTKRS